MKVLAITSGKGGVGKTTFSVNIARQLSLRGLKTLLIDFDIHNQGVSGLFMVRSTPRSTGHGTAGIHSKKAAKATSVIDLVQASDNFTKPYFSDLLPDLDFDSITSDGKLLLIPASLPDQMIEWNRFHAENLSIVSFFRAFFEDLRTRLGFDAVVIDCYGGIDSMTVAAAGIADDTIIVNEPDIITFTGTLKLYRYILDQYAGTPVQPSIHFIINRITSRHSYQFLHDAYSRNLASYTVDDRILAYFPYDKLIIETFGDYPFFSEILPRSLFTRKIRLLIEMLWGQQPHSSFYHFSRLSPRRKVKIQRQTSEFFFAEPDRIIRAFVRVPFFLCVPIVLVILLQLGRGHVLDIHLALLSAATAWVLFIGLTVFVVIFEPYQISKWMIREASYHRRKAKLKRSYNRATRFVRAILQYGQAAAPLLLGLVLCSVATYYVVEGSGFKIVGKPGSDKYSTTRSIIASELLVMWGGGFSGLSAGGDYSGMLERNPDSVSDGSRDSLAGAKFSSDYLIGTRFMVSDLSGSDFSNGNFYTADFSSVRSLKGVHFRDDGHDEFLRSSLDETRFADNADFSGASFDGIRILNTRFGANSNFQHAEFKDVEILGRTSFGTGSDLRDANFENVDFPRSAFRGTRLRGAKFTIHTFPPRTALRPFGNDWVYMEYLDFWYLDLNGASVSIFDDNEVEPARLLDLSRVPPGPLAYDVEADLAAQDPNARELDNRELAAIEQVGRGYQPWAGGAFLFLKVEKSITEGHPSCEDARHFSSWLAHHHGRIDWNWFTWDGEISAAIADGRLTYDQRALLGDLRNAARGEISQSYFLTLFPACSEPSRSSAR